MGGITTIGGRPSSGGGGTGETGGNVVASSPIGQVVQAVGGAGLLPMDGRVISKASYPELYAALNASGAAPMDFDVAATTVSSAAATWSVAYNAASNKHAAINLTTGAFYSSSDGGESWLSVSSPSTQTWRTLFSNNEIFVAVGASQTAISIDGMTWTNVVNLPTGNVFGTVAGITMAYSNGKFHLYGETNRVHLVSENGYDWTVRGIPLGVVNEVLFTGSGYVAYGYNSGLNTPAVSQVAISADGENWTLSQLGHTGYLTAGATMNGVVVLGMTTKILLSTDNGATWSNPTTLPHSVEQITTTTAGFVASCKLSVYQSSVYVSADGSTWTQVVGASGGYQFHTFNNNTTTFNTDGTRWVFSIRHSNVALYTDDFDTWQVATLPISSDWSTVTWNGTRFTILADTGTSNVISDDGGVTWTVGSTTVPALVKGKTATNSNGVTVVISATSGITSCLQSNDGITFTSRTIASGQWQGIAVKGTMFVIVNQAGGCASSPDGITWTARSVTTGTSVAANGNVFVTVKGVSGGNLAFSSPDGITWTQRTLPYGSGEVHSQVFWNGASFVSVGGPTYTISTAQPAGISTSTDGITWTYQGQSDLNGGQTFFSYHFPQANKSIMLAYLNDQVSFLENSMDLTGKLWTIRKLGLPQTFAKFGFAGQGADGAAAVGIVGPLVQRIENGVVTWSTLQGGENITSSTFNKLHWTGTKFIAQNFNSTGEAFHLTSEDGASWTKNASPATGFSAVTGDNLMIFNSGGVYGGNPTAGWTFTAHGGTYVSGNYANMGIWKQGNTIKVAYNGSTSNDNKWHTHPSYSVDGVNLVHTYAYMAGFNHEHLAVKGNLVVGCYASNYYFSEDGGETWKVNTLATLANIVTYNAAHDVFVAIYPTTSSKCMVSKDGKTWTPVDLPASASTQSIASIGKTMVISVTTGDWYYSTNGGTTWLRMSNPNTGLTWGPSMAGSANGIVTFASSAGGLGTLRIRKLFDELTHAKIPSVPQTVGTPQWFVKAK